MEKQKDLNYCIEEFMVYCKSKQLRPKTMKSYEQTLRLFERWTTETLNCKWIEDYSETVIRKYILELQQRGKYTFYVDDKAKAYNLPDRRRDFRKEIDNTTINNYIRNIKVFFNWLYSEDYTEKNIVKRINKLVDKRQTKEYITDDEFNKLINIFDKSYFSEHRDYAMIILMLDSGMRLGECGSLLVQDVNLEMHHIFLKAEKTKGRKDRTVYFSNKTETILRRWLKYKDRYTDSEYLFPSRKGYDHVTVQGFETNFTKYLHRAGINKKYSPHCLRNNFAKRCLMNGMDIYTLSRILGHSSVTVTEQAYLDLTDEDLSVRYNYYSPIGTMNKQ